MQRPSGELGFGGRGAGQREQSASGAGKEKVHCVSRTLKQ